MANPTKPYQFEVVDTQPMPTIQITGQRTMHTPGPYSIRTFGTTTGIYAMDDGVQIATDVASHNAPLLRDSPKMLELLTKLVRYHRPGLAKEEERATFAAAKALVKELDPTVRIIGLP